MQIKLSTDNPTSKSSAIVSLVFAAISALGPVIADSWAAMPDALRDMLPDGVTRWAAVAAFLLIFVARCTVIVQGQDSQP